MTDAPHPHQQDGSHEGPIRTPKQLIIAVPWAHIIPIVGILLLVAYVTATTVRLLAATASPPPRWRSGSSRSAGSRCATPPTSPR